jgi:hypothetical protein
LKRRGDGVGEALRDGDLLADRRARRRRAAMTIDATATRTRRAACGCRRGMRRFPRALRGAARPTEASSGGDLGRGRVVPNGGQAEPGRLKEWLG